MTTKAIRGTYLTFTGDPFRSSLEEVMKVESDGIILIEGEKIKDLGPAEDMLKKLPEGTEVTEYKDSVIMAGFIDSHVHYPQTQIIGAYGEQLIEWLNNYTFIAEQQFANKDHASRVAEVFLREQLRAGTTSVATFCTVYPGSVDAFFEASERLNMRNIAGKVMMDRNAPEALCDTAKMSYDDSKALIEKWHNKGRQMYAVTPRFAPTSTPEQLEAAGALWNEHKGTFMQTHVSENVNEVAWVKDLYPEHEGYLDVYDKFGLCGDRALFGHGIHLTEKELSRLSETGGTITHCPTSNFFLGSGFLNVHNAKKNERPVRVGLATDLGAGTSFSILQTLNETYKAAQLNGNALSAGHAFYMATRGTAESMCLDDKIGHLAPGMEADIVVLDLKSTPAIDFRMSFAKDFEEQLFILMTLGDDRATRATYVAGDVVYDRGAEAVTGKNAVFA
ncbi:guanine deaminase [Flexibacterium corallicola]|uniref:guanine deaminase n=1 Tax=Flexibacterium corallicola TaxID=3037259 RepID=UPI00286F588D|nr:guanine deaminase [Pseudovibrio sp. M1P-2-3]